MPGNNAGKGNPASKRMMNTRRKENRAKSWARGERRKAERVKVQDARHADNVQWLNAQGLPEYVPAEFVGGVRMVTRKRASKLVRLAKRAMRRAA